jgi:Holliday junction DNA helicase RuvA
VISLVKGSLLKTGEESIIVEVSGIGYEIFTHSRTFTHLPPKGETLTMYTRLHVTENDLKLYGFIKEQELNLFNLLLTVTGVGARVALNILGAFEPDRFCRAIAAKDEKTLVTIPGIGKKSAQRLIFELKDKVGKIDYGSSPADTKHIDDVLQALEALGYTRYEMMPLIHALQESDQLSDNIEKNLKIILREKLATK